MLDPITPPFGSPVVRRSSFSGPPPSATYYPEGGESELPEPPEPPRRRGLTWKGAFAISGGTVLLLVVAYAGMALQSRWEVQNAREARSTYTYDYTPSPELAALQADIKARQDADARIGKVIKDAVAGQAAALLAGDRKKFVSYAAPKYREGRDWLSDSFTSLRAMGIAQWTPTVDSWTSYSKKRWQSRTKVSYCFVAECATPSTIALRATWDLRDESRPRMTELYDYTERQDSPPWSLSVLKAKIGPRVIVAGSAANAGRLSSVLAKAEAAARIADRYAATTKPSKYLIYLAGSDEWDRWSSGGLGNWAVGYAMPELESVVLKASYSSHRFEVLRHELGHVSTLAGRSPKVKRANAWWLVEGLAEYVAAQGRPFAQYNDRAATVSFVRNKWNGDLRVGAPTKKSSSVTVSGKYGTAYLGVSCLMQKHGRAKALGFFRAVAVTGTSLATAATEQLGMSWPKVSKTCAAQIRQAVRSH